MDKQKLRQAIVVEGKYDQNTLRQIVDTAIFTTNGFTDMKDPALLHLLRQAAQTTGLVILTDSDGAGFLIRNTLKSALPSSNSAPALRRALRRISGVMPSTPRSPSLPGTAFRRSLPGRSGI